MSCTFLNPVWEQFHKPHRISGIGMEKTKCMNQEPRAIVVATQEHMTKTQKPSFSLFCISLYNYCMHLHASQNSGRGIPLLSGCHDHVFLAEPEPFRSQLLEVWIQPLPRKWDQLLVKAGCR